MQVRVGNKVYPSVKEAARLRRVKVGTIYAALSRGSIDRVGVGQGKAPPGARRGGKPKVPLTIGQVHFASLADAERALGYGKGTITKILREGGQRSRQGLLRRAMEYHKRTTPPLEDCHD